jgi:hypothetical protein
VIAIPLLQIPVVSSLKLTSWIQALCVALSVNKHWYGKNLITVEDSLNTNVILKDCDVIKK